MASVEQVAAAHYRRQVTLARRTATEAGRLWSQVDRADIARSWLALVVRLLTVVSSAQAVAAASSATYVDDALDAQGLDPAAEGRLRSSALAGIASDGRPLETLLYQPALRTLGALAQGARVDRALTAGRLELDLIVRTQVADAGRVADGVAITARRAATGYVRLLSPPSCARCVLLAGRRYRWSAGFQRHPRCDCRHIPAAEDTAGDLRTNPDQYFRSLSQAEQDRAFGRAGAQAIRDGAGISQVVNSRRGMYTASVGGRSVLATTESTTRRGQYRAKAIRLMPEQIYAEAKGNRDEALRLLRRFGYLT